MTPVLRVENLGKSFAVHELGKTIRACHGVSMTVMPGEFVGITGRSGSGKSTVLKMIYRTYVPDEGRVLYDSARFGTIDLCGTDERSILYLRKREIGYVSQFLNLIPRTTARSTIEEAALDMGRSVPEARDEAEALLSHFELPPELWDSFAATFSGGEKLRLNIARAMVKHPRLLLLDEPTASLDDYSKGKVRDLIERLKGEGTTMLGIFHDLEFMQGLCDREYAMSAGNFTKRADVLAGAAS
jgi:alpha-D-ribose 1-methylphosphonate 5-triphosphate synthase subunit PhnL